MNDELRELARAVIEKYHLASLDDILREEKNINAFVHIVLDNYVNHPVINTQEVEMNAIEYREEQHDELLFYKQNFDFSDKQAFTSSVEVYDFVQAEFPDLTKQKIKYFLTTNMKIKCVRKQIKGVQETGFCGLKLIQSEKKSKVVDYFN